MSTEITQTRYDTVPYPIRSFPQTTPSRLAALARLFGMTPAPADKCRVLELGCAQGGNLLPLAQAFPESSFVGIDLSSRQIEVGNKLVTAAGLANVELKQGDIASLDPAELGTFDYVIVHGVYSWVKADVQEKLLALARACLNPQGLAYVSYNTLPGWRMRGMLREMMLYHVSQFPDEETKAKQAYALINFLQESVDAKENPYGMLLKRELEQIKSAQISYFLHDFLEETNEPCYFHEFAGRALRQGLQYVGETAFSSMLVENMPEKAAKTLQALSKNIIATEQYMDFLRNRSFRQTVLCRVEQPLNRAIEPAVLKEFSLTFPLAPTEKTISLEPGVKATFRGANNAAISSESPYTKAFLVELLKANPLPISYAQAHENALQASAQFGTPSEQEVAQLPTLLISAFARGLLEVDSCVPAIAATAVTKPKATLLARIQAAAGLQVTSLRHVTVEFDAFSRKLFTLLDGERDVAGITQELVAAVLRKELNVNREGKPVENEADVRAVVSALVPRILNQVLRAGYLLG